MATYFLDSSAIVKYYVIEVGTEWVRQIIDSEEYACVVANISLAEVAAALSQLRRHGPFGSSFVQRTIFRFKEELRQQMFLSHTVDAGTISLAADLAMSHSLRGYDAVQIASALLAQQVTRSKFIFVSGDNQMLRAAVAVGLTTDNPFDHGDED